MSDGKIAVPLVTQHAAGTVLEEKAAGVIEGDGLPDLAEGIVGEVLLIIHHAGVLKRGPLQTEIQRTLIWIVCFDRQGIFCKLRTTILNIHDR